MFTYAVCRFTAEEVIGYIRVCRPGSVIGPQQGFIKDIQRIMWLEGDAYRAKHGPSPPPLMWGITPAAASIAAATAAAAAAASAKSSSSSNSSGSVCTSCSGACGSVCTPVTSSVSISLLVDATGGNRNNVVGGPAASSAAATAAGRLTGISSTSSES